MSVASDAMDALLKYDFPGNVRELENILERASILADGHRITRGELHLFRAPSQQSDETRASWLKTAADEAREDAEKAGHAYQAQHVIHSYLVSNIAE